MSDIDTSGIDATKPSQGSATTESVRDNFSAIKTQLGTAKTELGNLSGVTDAATARTNLGLSALAIQDPGSVAITGGSITGITDLAVEDGGTGASTAADARANLGAAGKVASPTAGNLISQTAGGDIQDAGVAAADVQVGLPRGYISGLYLSNGTDTANDIDIAVGEARDPYSAYDLSLASGLTKQLDATWAAGTAAGGLFSGTKAVSTTYHVFLIRADADGSIDAGFDTSSSAANIPTGYTAYRRIGSILTDGSGNIRQFTQVGDDFILADWVKDADTTVGTTAVFVTLSVPGGGVSVEADVVLTCSINNSSGVLVTSPYMNDPAVSTDYNISPSHCVAANAARQALKALTNTGGQLRIRGGAASQSYALYTFGWRDYRGTSS